MFNLTTAISSSLPIDILSTIPANLVSKIAGWFGQPPLENVSVLTQSVVNRILETLALISIFSKIAIHVVRESLLITLEANTLENSWQYAIFFVNIIAIFVLIAIALANALRLNLETYAIKKTLPSLIAGFILANFSLLLCKALLDVSDLLVEEIQNIFVTGDQSLIDQIMMNTIHINMDTGESGEAANIIQAAIQNFGSGAFADIAVITNSMASESGYEELTLIVNLLIASFIYALPLIVVIVLAFIVIIRHIIVHILIALAPIAIILLFFPPTKSIGEKWLNYFLTWTFILPIIFFILGVSTLFTPTIEGGDTSLTESIVGYMSGIFMMVVAILTPLSLSSFGQQLTSYLMMAPLYGRNPLSAISGLMGGGPSNIGGGGTPFQASQQTQARQQPGPQPFMQNTWRQMDQQIPGQGNEGQTAQTQALASPENQANQYVQGYENIGKTTAPLIEDPTDKTAEKNRKDELLNTRDRFKRKIDQLKNRLKKGTEEALGSKDKQDKNVPKANIKTAASPAGAGTGEKIDRPTTKLSQSVGIALQEMNQGIPEQYNIASYSDDQNLVNSINQAESVEDAVKIFQSAPVQVQNSFNSAVSSAGLTTPEGVSLNSAIDMIGYTKDTQIQAKNQASKIVQDNPNLSSDNLRGIMTNVKSGDYQKAIDMASNSDIKQLLENAQATGDNFKANVTIQQAINQIENIQGATAPTVSQKGLKAEQTASSTPPLSDTTIRRYNTSYTPNLDKASA